MASTSLYKATGRTERYGTCEVAPTMGMKYTTNPIQEGYAHTLVNYIVDSTTGTLRPRNGRYRTVVAAINTGTYAHKDYVRDIIYEGKLWVDVWTCEGELETGKHSITPELMDVLIVGENPTSISNTNTYFNGTFVGDSFNNTKSDMFTNVYVFIKDRSANNSVVPFPSTTEGNLRFNKYNELKGYELVKLEKATRSQSCNVTLPNGTVVQNVQFYKKTITSKGRFPKFCTHKTTISSKTVHNANIATPTYISAKSSITVVNNNLYFIGLSEDDAANYGVANVLDYNYLDKVGTTLTFPTDCPVSVPVVTVDGTNVIYGYTNYETLKGINIRHFNPIVFKQTVGDVTTTAYYYTGRINNPKEVSPSEVINYGYNMLKSNPYAFIDDTTYAANTLLLDGIVPYDEDGKALVSSRVGANISFRLFYKTNTTYAGVNANTPGSINGFRVEWSIQNANATGEPIILQSVWNSPTYYCGSKVSLDLRPTYKTFSLICKVFKGIDVTAAQNNTALATLDAKYNSLAPLRTISLASYTLTDSAVTKNSNLKSFYIPNCTEMCTWLERIVAWGVPEAETAIFVSEAGTTNYFPYPNGYDEFDGEIRKCVPYLDQLLVFTDTKLYLLTMNLDGLTFTKKCIQTGLNIENSDISSILVLSNMVFFKSRNYYYLVVPKSSSTTGELQLAPISKPILPLFDNFQDFLKVVLQKLYGDVHYSIFDYFTYSVGEEVCACYKICPQTYTTDVPSLVEMDEYIEVVLCYSTTSRVWRVETLPASRYRKVVVQVSSVNNTLIYDLDYRRTSVNGVPYYYLEVVNNISSPNVTDYFAAPGGNVHNKYGNVQYIDTGYRNFDEARKKRFREIQFNINCTSNTIFPIKCAIHIDDVERKPMYDYTVQYTTTDGVLTATVIPSVNNHGIVQHRTEGAEDNNVIGYNAQPSVQFGSSMFRLDTSKFISATNCKVRIKTSGKGYYSRFQLICNPEATYDLSYINWIYRSMNQR